MKDTDTMTKVEAAVQSKTFWLMNEILSEFMVYIEKERRWGLGCACHEEALQEAAHHHRVLKCPYKSMRGPQLHAHVMSMQDEFQTLIRDLCHHDGLEAHEELRQEIHDNGFRVLADVRLKFSFTNEMPWLLWQLRSNRQVGARVLRAYDTHAERLQRGRQSSIHRITARFGDPKGPLRRLVEDPIKHLRTTQKIIA